MINVQNLFFSYTDKPFIKDISFEVKKGEIFGFLGPSGAGKTTLQKILTGQLKNYEGSVKILGEECAKASGSFYEKIGVDFEFSTLYEKLSARDNLKFFGSLYENKGASIDQLLERVGLLQDGDKKVAAYSKGMKSRLNFIKALIHNPEVLFLDEPTSGLDPTNSALMKNLILEEKSRGKTIILTTHNMNDATELCDRVAFIVNGQMCALDSPHNLIMKKGATTITYTYIDKDNKESRGSCELKKTSKDPILTEIMKEERLLSIHSSEPTLNDIFIDITGRTLI